MEPVTTLLTIAVTSDLALPKAVTLEGAILNAITRSGRKGGTTFVTLRTSVVETSEPMPEVAEAAPVGV